MLLYIFLTQVLCLIYSVFSELEIKNKRLKNKKLQTIYSLYNSVEHDKVMDNEQIAS